MKHVPIYLPKLSGSLPVLASNCSSNPELMNKLGCLFDSNQHALELLLDISNGQIFVPYLSPKTINELDVYDDYYNVFSQTLASHPCP